VIMAVMPLASMPITDQSIDVQIRQPKIYRAHMFCEGPRIQIGIGRFCLRFSLHTEFFEEVYW